MLEMIITKVISVIDDLPTEILQRVRDAMARFYLQRYLESRKDDNPALFVGERAPRNRLGRRGIQRVFNELGKSAGLTRSVFPHLMRHTTATNALNAGASLTVVQKMLGHENPGTTQIYAELNSEEVRSEHRKHVA